MQARHAALVGLVIGGALLGWVIFRSSSGGEVAAEPRDSEQVSTAATPETPQVAATGDSTSSNATAAANASDPARFLHPPQPARSVMDHKAWVKMDDSGKVADEPNEKLVPAETVSYLQPRSKEDAQWLKENGFPSPDDLAAIDTLTVGALAARAAKGDLAAQSLLAQKQLKSDQILEAYANLQDAAVHGSVYALHLFADEMAQNGNQIEALAWFQVAGMRGDYSASGRIGRSDWGPIQPFAIGRSQRYALRYFENLSNERASLGLGPFVNRMRPGRDATAHKPGDYVVVYEPPRG